MSAIGLLLLGVVAAVGGANVFPEPRLETLPCGTTTMNPGERVAIQSPNFPQNYDTDYRCQYEITCNPMESTYLEFICPTFELESSTDCLNDRLVVTYHGSREEKCGSDSPDGTITSDGWTLFFVSLYESARKTAITTNSSSHCNNYRHCYKHNALCKTSHIYNSPIHYNLCKITNTRQTSALRNSPSGFYNPLKLKYACSMKSYREIRDKCANTFVHGTRGHSGH
ncbi:uncharacterized protein LOC119588918 [Penaeus monodon]|uniref:uncharacterized protein LOC119588918 n=1 Tax=Penaeus monodon TaxID=6687 RepID=UPI0018A732C4|nr:uncharacterized protein LOC119588918 [Penaeus monodon]